MWKVLGLTFREECSVLEKNWCLVSSRSGKNSTLSMNCILNIPCWCLSNFLLSLLVFLSYLYKIQGKKKLFKEYILLMLLMLAFVAHYGSYLSFWEKSYNPSISHLTLKRLWRGEGVFHLTLCVIFQKMYLLERGWSPGCCDF